jgi:hypothetical protein
MSAQVGWRDGQLVAARTEPQSVPGPTAAHPGEPPDETAARLAELIRRNPTLLDGRE